MNKILLMEILFHKTHILLIEKRYEKRFSGCNAKRISDPIQSQLASLLCMEIFKLQFRFRQLAKVISKIFRGKTAGPFEKIH